MNKQERKLKGLSKFKKRLANYGLTNQVGKFYSFKSHGKPCSCFICSTNKYKHNGTKKKELKEYSFEIENAA